VSIVGEARRPTPNGDFSKCFSPSLITDGTKCILLSTSVRLYQALEMENLGVAGPDKGKGGKYLILPPGYKGFEIAE
jgi:hypothetical protein